MKRVLNIARRALAQAWSGFNSATRRGRATAPSKLAIRRKSDVPASHELGQGQAVVVGPAEAPKWLTFHCPCGCGVPFLLSLSRTRRPRWTVVADRRGRPTVSPSVRRLDGCRSHFWIREGRIDWCVDTGLAWEPLELGR